MKKNLLVTPNALPCYHNLLYRAEGAENVFEIRENHREKHAECAEISANLRKILTYAALIVLPFTPRAGKNTYLLKDKKMCAAQ